MKLKEKNYDGANWNKLEDEYTQFFYEPNFCQFWRPEEISLQSNLHVWQKRIIRTRKKAYSRNLLILTFLDTYQGDIGMPVILRSCEPGEHKKKQP